MIRGTFISEDKSEEVIGLNKEECFLLWTVFKNQYLSREADDYEKLSKIIRELHNFSTEPEQSNV